MADNNSSEKRVEDIDGNKLESLKTKQDKQITKNKFIKNFCESKLAQDKNNTFLNNIMGLSEMKQELLDEIEKYAYSDLNSKKLKVEYNLLDIDSIVYGDIQKQMLPNYIKINRYRDNLARELFSEYDINTGEEKKIGEKIDNLSENDLYKLIGQSKLENRYDFLINIFGKGDVPEKIDLINNFKVFFKNIGNINDRKKLIVGGLEQFEKDELNRILSNFNNNIYSSVDLLDLFEYGFFNEVEKDKIVKMLLPNIDLKTALEKNIIDNDYANKFKKDLFRFYKDKYTLDEDEVNELSNLINNSEIYLSTTINTSASYQIDQICKYIYLDKLDLFVPDKKKEDLDNFIDKEKIANTTEAKNNFLNLNIDSQLSKKINKSNFEVNNYLIISSVKEVKQGDKLVKEEYPIFFKIINIYDDKLVVYNAGSGEVDLISNDKKELNKSFLENLLVNGIKIDGEDMNSEVKEIRFEDKRVVSDKINAEKYKNYNKSYTKTEYERLLEIEKIKDELNIKYVELKRDKFSSGILDDTGNVIDDKLNKYKELTDKYKELTDKNDKGDLDSDISDILNDYKNIELEIDKEIYESFFKDSEVIDKLNNIEDLSRLSFSVLENEINDIDEKGKELGLNKGVSFETKSGIFTIINEPINSGVVSLNSLAGIEENISYSDFIKGFKDLEAKRVSNFNTFDEVFNSLQNNSDIGGKWSQFKYENGRILKKDTKHDIDYGFLTSTESDNLIKIENISGGEIIVTFGEYEKFEKDEKGVIKKDKDGEKIKKKSFSLYSGSTIKVTSSWLDAWVRSEKAEPRSLDEAKDYKKEDIKTNNLEGDFFTRLFNRTSIKELISGGKFFFESIENYMKEGNEEHAARFASGVLGKVLPTELQSDLMSRTEDSQKKRADDYTQKLKNVDSWKATAMIEKWLLKRDTPQYKKEAGLIFVLEKYGVLYTKMGLHKHKGTFLWYEALGGKVGDKLYNEVKADADSLDENFREEELIYKLLVNQCKVNGYNGVKRRSRLHKEIKKLRAVGKQEEYETGKGDAKDERTVEKRIAGAVNELNGGNYPNAVGWLEEAVNKGGSMADMNKVPFIIAFSGIGFGFEQNTLDQLKNFPTEGRILPLLRLMSLKSDMKLVNDTILELAKRISEVKGNTEIYDGAKEIFDNQSASKDDDYTKIQKTLKYYEEYGDLLTRSLYMLNDGNKDKDSWLSKIIRLEKEPHIDEKGNKNGGNGIFKRYYDKLHLYSTEYKFDEDELQSDAFAGAGTSGINMHKSVKALLEKSQSGGYRMKKSGDIFYKEIKKELESIQERSYGEGFSIEERNRRQHSDMTHFIQGLISGLLEAHGGNINALNAMVNSNTSDFASMIHSKGLNLSGIFKYSSNDIIDGNANKLIKGYVDILLSGKKDYGDHNNHDFVDPTSSLVNDIKDSANDTLFDKVNEKTSN